MNPVKSDIFPIEFRRSGDRHGRESKDFVLYAAGADESGSGKESGQFFVTVSR